jgi:hypothetical protein
MIWFAIIGIVAVAALALVGIVVICIALENLG